MVRFTIDNRNRLIFYGNTVGYVKDDAAVVDEMFQTDELSRYLARLNLTPHIPRTIHYTFITRPSACLWKRKEIMNCNPRGSASTSVSTDAPVVVNPETLSNHAFTRLNSPPQIR